LRVPLETLDIPTESLIRFTPRVLEQSFGSIVLPRQISLLHSSERAPLSIIAHGVAVSAARSLPNAKCVFLDSGTNYSPALARSICPPTDDASEVLNRIIVGQVMGLTDIEEMMGMLSELGNLSVIVIDSLTGSLNLTGAPGTKGRQRELFHTLETIRMAVNKYNAHALITDHSSRNWISGEPIPIGGNILSHAVDSVVRIDRLRTNESLIRILTERCAASKNPPSIIVRADSKGIRSMK
jgi:RecA/RadA recombinase